MELIQGFPREFFDSLSFLGEEAREKSLEAMNFDPVPTFWINPLKNGRIGDVVEFFPTPLFWPGSFAVKSEQRDALVRSAPASDGRIFIQNASSQAAIAVLDPKAGEKILDLAAAPGGKTARIAALTNSPGDLAAVEVSKQRFFRMKENLRRCGAAEVKTYHSDGRFTGRKTPERFDAVLLDAPCSSEAVIRANQPKTWEHWSLARVRRSAKLQKELLASAIQALKPGGRILYSTCSLSLEENERVVDTGLKALDPMPFRLPILNSLRGEGGLGWRILPDGLFPPFYLCLLRKKE